MAHFEDEYAGTDAKFSYAGDRTHPMRSTVGKMPWHTDDKPFGVTQKEFEEMKHVEPTDETDGTVLEQSKRKADSKEGADSGRPSGSTGTFTQSSEPSLPSRAGGSRTRDVPQRRGVVRMVDYGNCCMCGFDADYSFKGFLYCISCYNKLEEDVNG